jgi:hypothetical protein
MKPLILTLLLAVAQPSRPPSPGDRQTQGQHQAAAAQEHSGAQAAQSNPQHPAPLCQKQPVDQCPVAPKPQPEGGWYASPDWWVAGFTGALFIATLGLWIFTGLMWWATRLAVADAGEGTRIANEALEHARESSERELRAYVSHRLGSVAVFATANAVQMTFVTENHGLTPASDLHTASIVDIYPYPLPQNFKLPDLLADEATAQRISLFPRAQREATRLSREFRSEELEDVWKGTERRIYAFSITQYVDAFGKLRTTNMSVCLGGPIFAEWTNAIRTALLQGRPMEPNAPFSFDLGPIHNSAD